MLYTLVILFLLLCSMPLAASEMITATITITNVPANDDTLTVNVQPRTWKTTVTDASLQIEIGADIEESRDNLFRHIASSPFVTLTPGYSGTDTITLRGIPGQSVTVVISGTWGEVNYTTNTITSSYTVSVPGSAIPTQSDATNIFSLLAEDLGTYSTSALAAGTTLTENFVQTTGAQTINGQKTFDNTTTFSSDTVFESENIVQSGGHFAFNPGAFVTFSDGVEFAGIIRIPDIAANALEITNAITAATLTTSGDVNADGVYGNFGTIAGTWEVADLSASGGVATADLATTGTITYSRNDVASLANGPNASVTFSGRFNKIDAGPTADFSIAGIAGGADGREIVIWNHTGQNLTFSHDSGVEATATNRIYTATGADVSTVGNGSAILIYDTEFQRWLLAGLEE